MGSKRYYIAADGGGTKLFALLFDEDYKLISRSHSGAVNTLFTDTDDVAHNMSRCAEQLFGDTGITEVECVYSSLAGPIDMFLHAISQWVKIRKNVAFSEGYAGLLAGIQKQRGILALSGTGSDVFWQEGMATPAVIGGWGALFGDEGSGYDIGVRALRAIQYADDGRGEPTMLSDMMVKDQGLKAVYDIVGKVYSVRDYRHIISSVCKTACNAAALGDKVATDIMRQAGKEMALQTNTLIARNNIPKGLDICVSGSVWRNNPHMYAAFCEDVNRVNPDYPTHKPTFEPVMAGVFHRALTEGVLNSAMLEFLLREYSCFIYEPDKR